MLLKNEHFDFCESVALLEETYTIESTAELIIETIDKMTDVSDEFKDALSSFLRDKKNWYKRVGCIYHYDIDLDYVVNGKTYNGQIADFGYNHVYDYLNLTEFYKEGNCTKLTNVDALNLYSWNDDNVFSREAIKSALGKVIEGQLPKGWQRYSSNSYTVKAYLVPLAFATFKWNGKDYHFNTNLHNGRYHYEWETNPLIKKKTKKVSALTILLYIPSILISGLVSLISLSSVFEEKSSFWVPLILSLGIVIYSIYSIVKRDNASARIEEKLKKDVKISTHKLLLVPYILVGVSIVLFIIIANL